MVWCPGLCYKTTEPVKTKWNQRVAEEKIEMEKIFTTWIMIRRIEWADHYFWLVWWVESQGRLQKTFGKELYCAPIFNGLVSWFMLQNHWTSKNKMKPEGRRGKNWDGENFHHISPHVINGRPLNSAPARYLRRQSSAFIKNHNKTSTSHSWKT